jgi:hypothetical protein
MSVESCLHRISREMRKQQFVDLRGQLVGGEMSAARQHRELIGRGDAIAGTLGGGPSHRVVVDLLIAWLDESYRAVAPKKLVKSLDGGAPAEPKAAPARGGARARPSAAKKKTKKKPAAKKRAR